MHHIVTTSLTFPHADTVKPLRNSLACGGWVATWLHHGWDDPRGGGATCVSNRGLHQRYTKNNTHTSHHTRSTLVLFRGYKTKLFFSAMSWVLLLQFKRHSHYSRHITSPFDKRQTLISDRLLHQHEFYRKGPVVVGGLIVVIVPQEAYRGSRTKYIWLLIDMPTRCDTPTRRWRYTKQ
jgi:hypothetical protein